MSEIERIMRAQEKRINDDSKRITELETALLKIAAMYHEMPAVDWEETLYSINEIAEKGLFKDTE